MPTRHNHVPPRKQDPAWERGRVTDRRPDGSEMPIFSPGTRDTLGVHEYSEKRRQVDAVLKDYKTRETPLPG